MNLSTKLKVNLTAFTLAVIVTALLATSVFYSVRPKAKPVVVLPAPKAPPTVIFFNPYSQSAEPVFAVQPDGNVILLEKATVKVAAKAFWAQARYLYAKQYQLGVDEKNNTLLVPGNPILKIALGANTMYVAPLAGVLAFQDVQKLDEKSVKFWDTVRKLGKENQF